MNYSFKKNKPGIRGILLAYVSLALVILYSLFRQEKNMTAAQQEFKYTPEKTILTEEVNCRESITFILGEDRGKDNPYYSEAINYYLYNEKGRTEYLVTECRSLLEVRDYLTENPPSNNLPWGLVNLVSHGNQWLGLSARVTPDSKRATTELIKEHLKEGLFPEVSDSLLDDKSELYIHGCGIGKNKELVRVIQLAFGGKNKLPAISASELYEYYTSTKYNGAIQKSDRYLAETWSVCYKMGYKPSERKLCQQFNDQYSDVEIDWKDALSRKEPRWAGDIYHYSFEVPVKWVIPYPDKDSLPDVSTKELQLNWLKKQSNICNMLDKVDIPVEKFNWWYRMVYINNEDGTRSPAIWVKGYCTILVVIKPLIDDDKKEIAVNTSY